MKGANVSLQGEAVPARYHEMVRSHLSFDAVLEYASLVRRPIVLASVVYTTAVLFFAVAYLKNDSKQALMFLALTALAPLGLYVALRAPLVFPFCAYIIILPFESLSSLAAGGTLAKLLGVLTAVAILVRVMRRGQALRPPGVIAAWLVLLCWMCASMLWALNVHDALGTFQMYLSLIALFVLLSITRVSSRELNCILGAIVFAGLISAGYDAYLYHTGQNVVSAEAGVSRVVIVVGDSNIDPNALAAALVLPSAIALYWLFNSRNRLISLMMSLVLAILLLGFAASGSRGGFIELAVVFTYLIIRSRHRLWLASLMIIATVTTLVANPGLPARFAQAQQDGAAGRRDIWNIGIHAFRDHWLLGAGVGNFANAFDEQYIKVYAQYVLGWHWAAHNVPLQTATELGVIGFVFFVVAMGMQFLMLRGLVVDNPLDVELRLVLEAAFLGTMVAGFSTSDLNAKYVWLTFSVMALYRGYLLSASALPKRIVANKPAFRPVLSGLLGARRLQREESAIPYEPAENA